MYFNSKKTLSTYILTVVLMFPYFGSLIHVFEDHDHKTCEISKIHLHELEFDCDILDYQFPQSTFVFKDISSITQISNQRKFSFFYSRNTLSISDYKMHRGPPMN